MMTYAQVGLPSNIEVILREIVERLVATYKPEEIILFGSYAYGHPDSASDLDLLIIKDDSETLYRRTVHVRRLLRDPQRLVPIELLILTPQEVSERLKLGDQFIADILARGKVLYERKGVAVPA